MAIDTNIVKTTVSGMSNVIPKPLVNELIKDLREASVYNALSALGIFKDYSGRWSAGGKTIDIPTQADITVASAVAEASLSPIVGTTAGNIQIVVGGVANAIQFTAESEQDVLNVFNDSYREQLINSMSVKLSQDVITELNTTTNVQYALKSDKTAYTSSDIDADARLSFYTVLRTKRHMSRAKPKALLVHPACAESLIAEGRMTENSISLDIIRSGVIGRYLGMFVIENDFVNSVSENSVDVYQNFMLAENAVAFAWKQPLSIDMQKDEITQRTFTLHTFMRYGMELRKVDLVYKIKAVSD